MFYWLICYGRNNNQVLLLTSKVVKRKIASGNSLDSQAQIEDLRLNYCIPKKNPKNNITGRKRCLA